MDLVQTDGNHVFWTESRPQENGRTQIVGLCDGQIIEILPAPFSARSRVYEYGGGAFCVRSGAIYFVNDADQQIYRVCINGAPTAVTQALDLRFADLSVTPNGHYILAIAEQRAPEFKEPRNFIAAIHLESGELRTLIDGADFYACPRTNTQGNRLVWTSWNHPNMPWDEQSLYSADFDQGTSRVNNIRAIAQTIGVSATEPRFSPDGVLFYISDQTGWWNLYSEMDHTKPLVAMEAEFTRAWGLAQSNYVFLNANQIICNFTTEQTSKLAAYSLEQHKLTPIDYPFCGYHSLAVMDSRLYCISYSATDNPQLIASSNENTEYTIVRSSGEKTTLKASISVAQSIVYTSTHDESAFGFYYPPLNPGYQGMPDEKPPLVIMVHGGPTSQTTPAFALKIQYWTSRGFAVFDVNYRGSSGYGRRYRELLYGLWGIADAQDCVYGARHLAAKGLADSKRLFIRGGSAGGFTVLSALMQYNCFRAAACYYGISDLTLLLKDTHKFESRYLDQLIGPIETSATLYEQRSPLTHCEKIHTPIIFFQGLQDKVVPPNQASRMVDALRNAGNQVEYVCYETEGHGFRRSESISHSMEAEYNFFLAFLT